MDMPNVLVAPMPIVLVPPSVQILDKLSRQMDDHAQTQAHQLELIESLVRRDRFKQHNMQQPGTGGGLQHSRAHTESPTGFPSQAIGHVQSDDSKKHGLPNPGERKVLSTLQNQDADPARYLSRGCWVKSVRRYSLKQLPF